MKKLFSAFALLMGLTVAFAFTPKKLNFKYGVTGETTTHWIVDDVTSETAPSGYTCTTDVRELPCTVESDTPISGGQIPKAGSNILVANRVFVNF